MILNSMMARTHSVGAIGMCCSATVPVATRTNATTHISAIAANVMEGKRLGAMADSDRPNKAFGSATRTFMKIRDSTEAINKATIVSVSGERSMELRLTANLPCAVVSYCLAGLMDG